MKKNLRDCPKLKIFLNDKCTMRSLIRSLIEHKNS